MSRKKITFLSCLILLSMQALWEDESKSPIARLRIEVRPQTSQAGGSKQPKRQFSDKVPNPERLRMRKRQGLETAQIQQVRVQAPAPRVVAANS
jgi:hypothetical protein